MLYISTIYNNIHHLQTSFINTLEFLLQGIFSDKTVTIEAYENISTRIKYFQASITLDESLKTLEKQIKDTVSYIEDELSFSLQSESTTISYLAMANSFLQEFSKGGDTLLAGAEAYKNITDYMSYSTGLETDVLLSSFDIIGSEDWHNIEAWNAWEEAKFAVEKKDINHAEVVNIFRKILKAINNNRKLVVQGLDTTKLDFLKKEAKESLADYEIALLLNS